MIGVGVSFMEHCKTDAIVIGFTDYGESDRIVTFYTEAFGRVKGMAKGARRSRKRFPNTLEPFSYIKTEVRRKGSGLFWVEHCSLLEGFFNIRGDIERFVYGSIFLEIVDRFTGEAHPIPNLFPFFKSYLFRLNTTDKPDTFTLYSVIRLLSILGYSPYLSGCVVCNREIYGARSCHFSLKDGGLVCDLCKGNTDDTITVSSGTINAVRLVSKSQPDLFERILLNPEQQMELLNMVRSFTHYQLGRQLNSWRLLSQVSMY